MSGPFDDKLEALRQFCDLLESTNPVVEKGASDLERLAQALSASEGRLASESHELETEVDTLEKEAAASEAAAVKACHELAAAADEQAKTELVEVEQQAAEDKGTHTHGLDQKGSALEAAFQELESQGWSPLDEALESERREFDRWTKEAEAALSALGQAAEEVAREVEHDTHDGAGALTDLGHAPFFDHAFFEPASVQARKVDTDVVHTYRDEELKVLQAFAHSYEELDKTMAHEAETMRGDVQHEAEALGTAIAGEANHTAEAVDATVNNLEEAKSEFERSAIGAEEAEPRAAALADLAHRIDAAEGKLVEIQAAMEAMHT